MESSNFKICLQQFTDLFSLGTDNLNGEASSSVTRMQMTSNDHRSRKYPYV